MLPAPAAPAPSAREFGTVPHHPVTSAHPPRCGQGGALWARSAQLHHGALCWALLPPHRRPSSPRRPRPKLCAESSKPGTTNPSSSGAPSKGEATASSATTMLNIFYSALSEDSDRKSTRLNYSH